jgi:hypothetical protein
MLDIGNSGSQVSHDGPIIDTAVCVIIECWAAATFRLRRQVRPVSTERFTGVINVRVLTSVTFVYDTPEDRILTAVNAGQPEAWSCWLTRRLALALLERATEYLSSTSALAQRAPADFRGEFVAFERDAAIAKTAGAMSNAPADVLKSSATGAELAERLIISNQGDRFRLELHGQSGGGAVGALTRAEFQRILQMLQAEVAKAGWLATPAKSQPAPANDTTAPKPVRH